MTERRGTKALELWCRRITDGYPGVNVQNMTTSWRDGLAFCAMIHHFRPDLIDFDSLNKDDVYGNNELAFRTAAEHLGIPALLDAEDMASCSVPDRLSILTYLSQFYQNFGGSSPSRLALSRTKESSNEGISPVVAESTKPKVGPRVMGMRRESCTVCGMPVFLAEKLMISRSPYHRTCFRCARCNNQLTPGNYYETEEGQYCCETCPDEEQINTSSKPIYHQAYNEIAFPADNETSEKTNLTSAYQRSLSDEEKTEIKVHLNEETHEKRHLTTASGSNEKKLIKETSLTNENISQSAQMRLNFMANNMLSKNPHVDTEKTTINDQELNTNTIFNSQVTEPPGGRFSKSPSPEGAPNDFLRGDGRVDTDKMPIKMMINNDISNEAHSVDISESSGVVNNTSENLDDRLDYFRRYETREKSLDTATSQATQSYNNLNSYLDLDNNASVRQDTKDKVGLNIESEAEKNQQTFLDTSQSLSLVQRRRKMFENPDNLPDKDETKAAKNSLIKEENSVDGEIFTCENKKIDENNRSQLIDEIIEIGENSKIDLASRVEDFEEEDKEEDEEDEEEKEGKDEEDVSKNDIINDKIDEIETNVPPIVPKRKSAVGAAFAKSRTKNAEVTVLNAPGIDLSAEEIYPEDLNPFKSDEEEETPGISRNIENNDNFEISRSSKVSTNPFGSSDEEEEEQVISPPRPAVRTNISGKKSLDEVKKENNEGAPTKRLLKAPQIQLNPFWSDDDDDEDDHNSMDDGLPTANTPIPKPRTITQTSQKKREFKRGDIYASNSSLGSTGSTSTPGGTCRKKKPAPPPPIAKELFTSDTDSFLSPNKKQIHSSNNSLHTTPRARKAKPAPPPPMPTSTPYNTNLIANLTLTESPINDSDKVIPNADYKIWKEPKNGKDEANRNKQSMSCDETNIYAGGYADKSIQGKWKRKKGPAPARPIPHRRKIKVMSMKDVKLELDEIEMQQQGLEKQGVRLEQLIRDKTEGGNAAEETSLGMDAEELVLELFVLVNEKNELFRRQAELMLLRRQQRLEEEHADIEYQIRCLLCQPEATKTDFDKQREETLIQRLVEIVERRNEIVECLEMDRRREVEEDRSINTQMGLYAAKTKQDFRKELEDEEKNRSRKSKKSKLKEKAKEKILRKGHKKDADKDVDETEVKLKRQNKKKWF